MFNLNRVFACLVFVLFPANNVLPVLDPLLPIDEFYTCFPPKGLLDDIKFFAFGQKMGQNGSKMVWPAQFCNYGVKHCFFSS